MRRGLEIAALGPAVGDHARVGAVILSPDGTVLAEGWHKGAGTPHAEVDAMAKVDPAHLRGATAVVTLEPCNHTGRTGPCALALIEAGIGRVVYAIDDPGAHVHGGADRSVPPVSTWCPASSRTRPRHSSSAGCSPSGSVGRG